MPLFAGGGTCATTLRRRGQDAHATAGGTPALRLAALRRHLVRRLTDKPAATTKRAGTGPAPITKSPRWKFVARTAAFAVRVLSLAMVLQTIVV